MNSEPTKPCKGCRLPILIQATRCNECSQLQHWWRHFISPPILVALLGFALTSWQAVRATDAADTAATASTEATDALRLAETARKAADAARKGAVEAEVSAQSAEEKTDRLADDLFALSRLTTDGAVLEAIKRHSYDNGNALSGQASAKEFLKYLLEGQRGVVPDEWTTAVEWAGWVRDHAEMLDAYKRVRELSSRE